MPLTRRALIATAGATLLAPRPARAAAVTDDAGRAVQAPAKVQRVYPAGLPAAILLYTLAPDLLLGWPRSNRPQDCAYMLPDICARPEVGRITGRSDTANLETVAALKPDLILDVGSTGPRYVALADRVQQQAGIPYALLSGGILALSTSYEKLGRLIGREAAGADFADYCNMTLGVITNRIAFVPADKRPRVYSARGPRGLTTALGESSHAELIELVARNVAGEAKGELAEVTLDQVRQWDPDVIVTIHPDFAASVRGDPAWASIKAVREGRVHLMAGVPFGWFDAPPSGNRLIGLWWLAKILYPDLFKDDLRELTRDFYEKFYHVKPTDLRIDYVLAGRN
ncbi:MAG: ABC transporter substrate-binding protein [Pseudolabrys sp.]|jgi:iron complex transport system substrate-binding protein